MGLSIVKVAAGGLPVTIATTGGLPCTEATNGYGIAVTQATNGLPVTGFAFGPDVTAPVITSSASVSNIENTALAHTLTANEPVTWAIVAGGADNARFELSGSTLRWLSNGTKDFEAPNDANVDNAYIVTVRATDLAANPSTTQTITVTVTNVTGVAPAAPVLDLLTDGTDNTPDFTLTGDLALSDTVRFQYGTASDFTGASELTNAIDAGEDAANAISFSTGSLANGTWYFRARIERPGAEGAAVSGWSNTETIAISVVSSSTVVLEETLIDTGGGNWGSGYTVINQFTVGSLGAATGNEIRVTAEFETFSAGAVYELWFGKRNMAGDEFDFTGDQVNIKFGGNSTITGNGSTLLYVSDWVALGAAYNNSVVYLSAQQNSGGTILSKNFSPTGNIQRHYAAVGGAATLAATTDKGGFTPSGGGTDILHFISKIEIR